MVLVSILVECGASLSETYADILHYTMSNVKSQTVTTQELS